VQVPATNAAPAVGNHREATVWQGITPAQNGASMPNSVRGGDLEVPTFLRMKNN
jgi:hypothetical protein